MRIPKDLIHVMGTERIVSLKTGDYSTALLRHSEETAKFHIAVLTERARLGRSITEDQSNDAERAYQIVKSYFDTRIAALEKDHATRLHMLLTEPANAQRPDIDVLAELDTDLVEIIDEYHPLGQRRVDQLTLALAAQNGQTASRDTGFMRLLGEQVRKVLVELAASDRAHFLGEEAAPAFKRFSAQTPPKKASITFGALADSFLNDVLKVQPGRPRTMKKHEATLGFLTRHFGADTPVETIQRQDAIELRDLLAEAPTNAVQRFGRDLTLRELVTKRGDPRYIVMGQRSRHRLEISTERLNDGFRFFTPRLLDGQSLGLPPQGSTNIVSQSGSPHRPTGGKSVRNPCYPGRSTDESALRIAPPSYSDFNGLAR